MILFVVLVAIFAALRLRRKPREVSLLYGRGELRQNYAVFSCGCRFNWSRPDEPPTICQAHRAIIDSEVAA